MIPISWGTNGRVQAEMLRYSGLNYISTFWNSKEEEVLTRSVTVMLLRLGACYCISNETSNLTTTTDFGSHYRWTLFCVVFPE